MFGSFKFAIVPALLLLSTVSARPLYSRQNRNGNGRNGNAGAGATAAAKTTASDGSTIIDDSVVINGLTMRFKVSAPATALVATAGAAAGTLGINVLFHGDGGQSFVDFPNQGVNAGLMGVALLSPDANLRWGGGAGLVRPDGPAHSAAVNQFITKVLPTIVNFDADQVFMEGISGGSLMLSGFTLPTFGASLAVKGAVLGCGGLEPQVAVKGDISNMRIHWQSSVDELAELKASIPTAILAYEQLAADAGLATAQINALQTADASPNGGHCEFDEKDFVTGVQLLTDNFSDIVDGAATLNGASVTSGVVGNENLFGGAAAGNAAAATGNGRTGNNRAATAAANGRNRNGRKRSLMMRAIWA